MKKETRKKLSLIWRFLNGSKRYFLLSMIFTAAATLGDMVIP